MMKLQATSRNWIATFLVIVALLGACLRFTHLDKKIYWIDEVHTSLRAAGFSRTEFVAQAPRNKIVGIEQLHRFQKLTPERNMWAGVKAIASSEHSPLYYGLARIGMELFGSSIKVTRWVAAALGLLLLPAIYLLSQELFNSRLISLVVTALVAVSPVQILYAQEAREYSLFAVTIVVASLAFLRLLKTRKNSRNWHWYGLSIALGLYTQPLFLMVMIAHGFYSLVITGFSWGNLLKKYCYATALGIFLFIPWILVFIFNQDGVGMWIERDLPLRFWLQRWMLNLSATFFDWQSVFSERFFDVEKVQDFNFPFDQAIALWLIPIFGLILYSCYFLLRYAPRKSSFLLVCLIGVATVALGLPDLISGGQRSTVARYMLAVPLSLQIIVGYCLGTKISSPKIGKWGKFIWRFILAIALTTSLLCSWKMVQAPTWWNKYSSYYNAEVAEIINQAETPLVISNAKRISRSTSLSYQLRENAKFLLLDPEDNLPSFDKKQFSDIFLFRPYPEFLAHLQQNQSEPVTIETVFAEGHLYRLKLDAN